MSTLTTPCPQSAILSGPVAISPPTAAIRVLHVINGEHYSGAERVQDLLACSLPEYGFEVGFACVKPVRFAQMRRSRSVPLFEVPMWGRLDLRAARSLVRLVRSGDYRLIHAHTPRTALVGRFASRITNVPLVYHVHSPARRDTTQRLRNQLSGWVEQWSLRGAARLIAVSRSLREQMIDEGFQESQVTYVPNGVPPAARLTARRRPVGHWRLGVIGLFRPRKGLEVLMQVVAQLRESGAPVVLHIVGEFETPSYERSVKGLADRLGIGEHLRWRGFRKDIYRELESIDLFVLPSLFGEGLPMVILEAMSAGIPVVATRVEGIPDAVRHGQDGLLVEPCNAPEMARAIQRILSNELDWMQLRKNVLTRHAQRFSDRAMAEGVARVYREVLATA